MQTFVTLTAVAVASMAALTAAVPLAHVHQNHQKLHAARHVHAVADLSAARYVEGESIAERAILLDLENGTCGGSTGFGCAAGFCCSQWGFCGQGDEYCGSGSNAGSTAGASPAASLPTLSSSLAIATKVGPEPSTWTLPSAATTYQPSTTVVPSPPAQTTPPAVSSPATTAPVPSQSAGAGTGGSGGFGDIFKMYSGNGDASQGWPTTSDWVSFDSMWAQNENDIMESCSQFGVPNNSEEETADLKSAITSVGASAGVDPRFILAIVLQESAGCVRAPTTNYGVTNPGLMQSHDGSGSCNNGQVLNPCPMSEITQMIEDGTEGTSSGDGLKQCLASAPSISLPGAAKYYQAARIYNSGSIAAGGNLDDGIATQCYSTDIANRLTGWVNAPSTCNLAS